MQQVSSLKRRICALSFEDWAMLAESALALILASALIRFLPFRQVAQIASSAYPIRDIAPDRRIISKMGWALAVVASAVPWRAVCFHKGVAAQFMLRRRRLPSALHYGIHSRARHLKAHVWVMSGDEPVVGVNEADQFACVATFPPKAGMGRTA